jgi:catechol 2,3-dioxygenase-like lactoylglutathione lyase family enzyme
MVSRFLGRVSTDLGAAGACPMLVTPLTPARSPNSRSWSTRAANGYHCVVLGDRPLMAFIPVRDLSAAQPFYSNALGLRIAEESPYAMVLDAGGTMLRLTQVDDFQPQPFTIAGWRVLDMGESIDTLASRGVAFIRYEGMDQDARGIWSTPSGDQVAWFKDPDGNTLSLTCFAE